MNRACISLILCATLTLIPLNSLGATVRLGVSGGFSNPVTEGSYGGAAAGPTVGGEVLLGLSPAFYLGAGFDFSSYAIEGYENNIGQIDVNGVVRYFFPGQGLRLFLAGAIGYSRQSLELPADSVTQDLGNNGVPTLISNGFAAGPVIGVAISAGPIDFEVSLGAYFRHYGDARNEEADQAEPTATHGLGLVGRIGLAVPLRGN